MFNNMYDQYYNHKKNRWASFVIDDVLEQVQILFSFYLCQVQMMDLGSQKFF